MQRRVLVVGNCTADHAAVRRALREQFDVEVVHGFTADDTLELLGEERFDLVLINRSLHGDGSDGIELIRQIKAHPQLAGTAVMLLSDYGAYQEQAVAAGALPGFGKTDIGSPQTHEKLRPVLS